MRFLRDRGRDLREAARKGSEAELERMLKGWPLRGKADPNAKGEKGWTALHAAAEGGHAGCAWILLAAGADPDARADLRGKDQSALELACKRGDAELVAVLLEAKAKLSGKELACAAAVPMSAGRSGSGVVKLLLEAGAEGKDEALIAACAEGNRGEAKELLKAGANPNATGTDGKTALLMAVSGGSEELVWELLQRGADPEGLWWADGMTALMLAAAKGSGEMVKELLSAGADPKRESKGKRTALHFAAAAGDARTIKLLIEAGADLDAKDEVKRTALHFAAAKGNLEPAMLLVEAGADLDAKNGEWKSAEEIARGNGKAELADKLNAARLEKGREAQELEELLKERDLELESQRLRIEALERIVKEMRIEREIEEAGSASISEEALARLRGKRGDGSEPKARLRRG